MTEYSENFLSRHRLILAKVLVDTSEKYVPLQLLYHSAMPVTLYKGTMVGPCHAVNVVDLTRIGY